MRNAKSNASARQSSSRPQGFAGRHPPICVISCWPGIATLEDAMRIFAFVLLTLVLGASPASAWQEYIYLDQGFAIQFMAKPQVTTAPYPSTLVKGLRSTVYSQEDDHVLYRMTVVDLAGHTDAGSNFLNEAAYNLMREGEVIFNDFPRVYQDEKAIYGVTLVVDRPDGRRVRTSLHYHKGP